jgi:threonine/homoserine/homoserine lactone efflux protein
VVGVAAAGAIVLAVVGPSATSEGQPEDWTFWLKLVLGVLLIVVGIREWRGRPGAGDEVELPKWMSALDRFTPAKAAGSGVLLSALNPKNLIFIVGGATVVAQAAISGGGQAVVWALFTLIASIGVLVPVAIYFALGERASALLDEIKTWMARNNAAVMAVLILVIGVKLIGDGIAGLSA